ncbi:MAG TPA: rhomboid family intramembrane serine protease [Polyangia bacterium]|jgi:membrane associated rhomboid family serine protease|nr:rhomboid family intramembrane serine protease [Polyangia bacterium]
MSWFRRLSQTPVTAGLLVANVLVYALMAIPTRHYVGFNTEELITAGANLAGVGAEVTHWRWLSAAFIHVNLLHILMNMWVLSQIGAVSEKAIGRGLFAASYVVTGTVGNMLSTAIADMRGRPLVSAGASGAIMGLIGIAVVFAWRTGQKTIAKNLLMNVALVLMLGLFANLDNGAHIGGLLAGGVIGFFRVRWPRPLLRWLDLLLLVLSAAVSLAAFVIVRSYGGTR